MYSSSYLLPGGRYNPVHEPATECVPGTACIEQPVGAHGSHRRQERHRELALKTGAPHTSEE